MTLFNCSISFVDSRNRTTSRSLEIDAADNDAAKLLLDDIISALADISDCRVFRASIAHIYDVTDAEASVSNIDEGMSIRVQLNTTPIRYASFNVPGPEAAIVDPDGDLILTDPDVEALEDALQAAGVKIAHQSVVAFHSGKLDK